MAVSMMALGQVVERSHFDKTSRYKISALDKCVYMKMLAEKRRDLSAEQHLA